MAEYLEYAGSIFVVGEPIADRFSEFTHLVESYGLSTFVSFVMFKRFEHTEIDLLNDHEKEELIEECQPLIHEALIQGRTMQ